MKGLLATHYLVSLLDIVYKLLDEPETWLNLLLIDHQKAFDLVSHNVLVDKLLKEFNVPHFLVNIIASFLSNRSRNKPSFTIPIPNEIITTKTKLLGVTLTSDLKWEAHIFSIVKQASASLSPLKLFAKFSCPK